MEVSYADSWKQMKPYLIKLLLSKDIFMEN